MTGSGNERVSATATEWRTESRYYRRSPGWGWLLGLLLIPLLFGWLSWGALKPTVNVSAPGVGVTGSDWIWIGVAFVLDLGHYTYSAYGNRDRIPGAGSPS